MSLPHPSSEALQAVRDKSPELKQDATAHEENISFILQSAKNGAPSPGNTAGGSASDERPKPEDPPAPLPSE